MTDSSHCGSRGLVAMAAVHAHFPQGQPLTLCVCGQGSVHPSNCRIFTALDDCMSSSITLSWLPLASVTLKISLFVFLSFFFFHAQGENMLWFIQAVRLWTKLPSDVGLFWKSKPKMLTELGGNYQPQSAGQRPVFQPLQQALSACMSAALWGVSRLKWGIQQSCEPDNGSKSKARHQIRSKGFKRGAPSSIPCRFS